MSKFYLDDDPEENKRWTLAEIYADLATRDQIAKELNITIWRMNRWLDRAQRVNCPKPVREFPGVKVYSIQEWKGWFAAWEKRITRKTPENKWIDAKPHGAGQPFFTYDNPEL